MRSFTFTLFACLCLCIATVACRRTDLIRLQPTIEEQAPLANVVRMGDPASDSQLLSGFHELEQGSWRWSAGHFSVALAAPPSARTNGAWLVLDFSLPDASIDALKNVTVSCKVADAQLPPETFRTAGEHEYRREVPAAAFIAKQTIAADFSVDKFLKPPKDGRELGLVVAAIRLDPK